MKYLLLFILIGCATPKEYVGKWVYHGEAIVDGNTDFEKELNGRSFYVVRDTFAGQCCLNVYSPFPKWVRSTSEWKQGDTIKISPKRKHYVNWSLLKRKIDSVFPANPNYDKNGYFKYPKQ